MFLFVVDTISMLLILVMLLHFQVAVVVVHICVGGVASSDLGCCYFGRVLVSVVVIVLM